MEIPMKFFFFSEAYYKNFGWKGKLYRWCSANQWTGVYMITASIMKELNQKMIQILPDFFSPFIYIYPNIKNTDRSKKIFTPL